MFQTIINDRFARGIIRRKVRQLIERSGFHRQDADDLEQELLYMLLRSLKGFKESHPQHRNAFITAVVERSATTIRRRNMARRNCLGTFQSLDASISGAADGKTAAMETDDPDSQVAFDHIDLMLDVPAILDRLPDDLRDLAHRLQGKKLAEIARDLNSPLSSLQRRRDRLRVYLADLQKDFSP